MIRFFFFGKGTFSVPFQNRKRAKIMMKINPDWQYYYIEINEERKTF